MKRISAFKPVWLQPWLVAALLSMVAAGAFLGPRLALWQSFPVDKRESRKGM